MSVTKTEVAHYPLKMVTKKRSSEIAHGGSMADIAFLLLLFFMLTTTIVHDKGIDLLLPPEQNLAEDIRIKERNLFKILLNSNDELLVEDSPRRSAENLRTEIKEFILNPYHSKELSENSLKAVVSIKTNRGTSQAAFISVLDEAKAAYFEIYGDRVGMSAAEFRTLKSNDPRYKKARLGVPMNISIAEPH
ncbi:MAG: biopolymer transporter ExbD [Bacteroidota bacterium]